MLTRYRLGVGLRFATALLLLAVSSLLPSRPAAAESVTNATPRRIILFIGDGLGLEQVKLGRCFANGDTAPLNFEDPQLFPVTTRVRTENATNAITDSAAGATAMATGRKVHNYILSVAEPGDGKPLTTILELIQHEGGRAGLVTHSGPVTDATPAAFGAHQTNRVLHAAILDDYLQRSRPQVLFGRRQTEVFPDAAAYDAQAAAAGYQVVRGSNDLQGLDPARTPRVFGSWTGDAEPSLAALTAAALPFVDQGTNAFFLLVEEQLTDLASHHNDAAELARGVINLRDAVAVALDWTKRHPDILIVLTADHETGGLTVGAGPYQAGTLPSTNWISTGHTATPVGLWLRPAAPGRPPAHLPAAIENTDVFGLLGGRRE